MEKEVLANIRCWYYNMKLSRNKHRCLYGWKVRNMKMKQIKKGSFLCVVVALAALSQAGFVVQADNIVDAKPIQQEVDDQSVTGQQDKEQSTEQKVLEGQENSTEQIDEEGQEEGWNQKKTCYYIDGHKVKGVQQIDGELYYFTSKGTLYTKKGLRTLEGKTYFFNKNHTMKTGVIKINKKAYYFQEKTGKRIEESGYYKEKGKTYLVKEDYSLKSGWYRDETAKRYYFDKKSYAAVTGWKYIGKYKYFFNKKGQLSQDLRKKLKKKNNSYMIKVNRTACCVTVYAKDGLKGYTIPVVAFVSSSGKDTPTGSFRTGIKHRWHELFGPCWGQWTTRITGNILFHSVYYDKQNDNKSLNVAAYNKLGTMASHGCIRLRAGDAKWIYDNCAEATKVVIYNNKKNPGPFDKPEAEKLGSSHTWDPTDPAF